MTYSTGDVNEGNSWDAGGSQAQAYRNLQKKQQEVDALLKSYSNPQTGFGGFSYAPSSTSVLPKGLGAGYGQAASYILGGSQGAQEQLRQQYEAMLRSRSGGYGMAYSNQMQRGQSALAGQGVSPQLANLLLGGQRASLLGQMSSGIGADEAQYHSSLGELYKGTGTELAGLKTGEIGNALNYMVGKQAIDASKPDALTQLIGLATGAAGIKKVFGR